MPYQLQLGQIDRIPHMVGALGGALADQLCQSSRRNVGTFRVLRLIGQLYYDDVSGHQGHFKHEAHITGGGRGRHVGPRQVGTSYPGRVLMQAYLDEGFSTKGFDGVVPDRLGQVADR